MGGRGSSSGAGIGPGGGGARINVLDTSDLVSMREEKRAEVDLVLGVGQAVEESTGYDINRFEVATLSGRDGASTMAYYEEGAGVLAINDKFFDSAKMESAYADCVKTGFHPNNGNYTGMEATVAHEFGHALTDRAALKMGMSFSNAANKIVRESLNAKNQKAAVASAGKISGYAKSSDAECIAEAYCDVFCNGQSAAKESISIVNTLNKYLK